MPREPGLWDAIHTAIEARFAEIHTALPGRIEKYDHEKALAEVQPLLRKNYRDGTSAELPIIANVPVVWPRTSEFAFAAPLARGDSVLLVFCERSLEGWLSNGGLVTPTDRRKFDLSDAVAIPGLWPFSEDTGIDAGDEVQIRYRDARIRIQKNGTIDMNDGNLTVEAGT